MRLGIDVSSYIEEKENGARYFSHGKEVDPIVLFRQNGVDCMRIRLWLDPKDESGAPYLGGNNDLEVFFKLASIAKDNGYSIMLDLHYSDFWCDPSKQTLPKAWSGFDFEETVLAVYSYTVNTLGAIKERGIDLFSIQVGNEITNGMLWPHGRLSDAPNGASRGNYGGLISLINAGIKGCREIYPEASVILHLEKSYDQYIYNEFMTHMTEAGVDFDCIGFSYYPYWHGTFDQFFSNVEMCKKFGKKLMVVELGYAFTLEDYIKKEHGGAGLVVSEENVSTFSFTKEYPITPEGQAHFIEDFLSRAERSGIDCVFWWEPLWIPGEKICWASREGQKYIGEEGKQTRNEWANQCLFGYDGEMLPAFAKFANKNGGNNK